MLLLIDNYDSFTYNLKDYFEQLGEDVIVVKNDEIDAHSVYDHTFDKIVISPGPNTPSDAGNLMDIINAVHDEFPILGICLGHQALGQYYGSELRLAQQPMHGKVSEISHDGEDIYDGLPQRLKVCRYHSLVLHNLDEDLVSTASTDNGECMSFRHKFLPVTGIQYHPEAILTEHGLDILRNWLALIA